MTWVKICGMTNLEDALAAVEAGADAVGFVFYEKSPRRITVEGAREIVEKLPESVEKIGVFVDGAQVNPLKVLLDIGLSGMQSYPSAEGSEQMISHFVNLGPHPDPAAYTGFLTARFLTALPMKIFGERKEEIQVLAAKLAGLARSRLEQSPVSERSTATVVLDSGDLRQPGGTGKTFDWDKAVPISEGMRQGGVRLVVAGGLTPENVGQAMGILKPWGVDVASGVEARPGKKDPEKVRAFVKAVRDADRKTS
jgi:phosphoribosylanthranilate isomerase